MKTKKKSKSKNNALILRQADPFDFWYDPNDCSEPANFEPTVMDLHLLVRVYFEKLMRCRSEWTGKNVDDYVVCLERLGALMGALKDKRLFPLTYDL